MKATAGRSVPVRQDASCQSSPCDLSQLSFWVLLGGYSGRKPRVLHRLAPRDPELANRSNCGNEFPAWHVMLSTLLNPALVRPCKRCWPDYRQPPQIEPPTVGVRATVTIDTSQRKDRLTRPVAVFGVRYHFMEPFQGNDDAFAPICGTGGLYAGKGRLRSESDAISAGATMCTGCSDKGSGS